MAFSPPQFTDIQNSIIADITNNLIITNPQTGQRITPNFSVGSVLLTFSDVLALVLDAFYNQLLNVDSSLRLATAQGSDLDDIIALFGGSRITGLYAQVPALFTRDSPATSVVNIPTDITVVAKDQFGNPTIEFTTIQDWTLPLGVAGQFQIGTTGAWAMCQCTQTGILGNVGAGQVVQLSDMVSGVTGVSNPALDQPSAPVVTQVGTAGNTTRNFAIVARGLTGTTQVGVVGTTTTGALTPDVNNYDHLAWDAVTYATSYDVLIDVSTSGTPLYQLLANVPNTQTTYDYQGQASSIYPTPTNNTSNSGVGGVDDEDDDALRKRIPTLIQIAATSSEPALLASVSSVSGVTRVYGSDDATAGKYNLYYVGVSYPLPDNILSSISSAIKTNKAAGIQVNAVQVSPTTVNVAYTIVPASGVDGSTLISSINTALESFFGTLAVGAPVYNSQVVSTIMNTDSRIVKASVNMTVGGTAYNSPADVPAVAGVIYGIGTITSTIAAS